MIAAVGPRMSGGAKSRNQSFSPQIASARCGCLDAFKSSIAVEIAAKGPVATRLAKESVNRAYETTLQAGLEAERRALYLAFASEDAREGLTAFTEKRNPRFRGR